MSAYFNHNYCSTSVNHGTLLSAPPHFFFQNFLSSFDFRVTKRSLLSPKNIELIGGEVTKICYPFTIDNEKVVVRLQMVKVTLSERIHVYCSCFHCRLFLIILFFPRLKNCKHRPVHFHFIPGVSFSYGSFWCSLRAPQFQQRVKDVYSICVKVY